METDNSLEPASHKSRRERAVPRELADHPRYAISRVLGVGGMGVVYQAEHRIMERPVALKVIHPQALGNAQALERFRREVRAAAKLSHPNIVAAYDADQAGPHHFLVMEYVEGTTLSRLVERKGRLPVVLACQAARQAALGLQQAFEQGMVHRDIKPQNLMMDRAGQVKIMDFGLARVALTADAAEGGRLTTVGSLLGTPDYMAPEQANDSRSVDIRGDLYSLGCTLYFLLAGRVPFPEGTPVTKMMSHLELSPTPLEDLRPNLPAGLAEVVARLMAKRPEDRYQTPAEAAEALLPYTVKTAPAPGATDTPDLAIAIEPPSVQEELRGLTRPAPNPKRRALVTTCLGMVVVTIVGVLSERSSQSTQAARRPARASTSDPASTDPPGVPRVDAEANPPFNAARIPEPPAQPAEEVVPTRPEPSAAGRTVGVLVAPRNYDGGELDRLLSSLQSVGVAPVLISASSVDPEEVERAREAGLAVQNLDQAVAESYDALIVIGGDGVREYLDSGLSGAKAQGLLRAASASGKPVASIGMGAGVLADAHLLRGHKVAAPPWLAQMLRVKQGTPVEDGVVAEPGILTARGPDDVPGLVKSLLVGLGSRP